MSEQSMGDPRYILSFGGGVNSVALMVLLLQWQEPLHEVVFADTGGEVPETYAYLDIVREFLKPIGIPFTLIQHRKRGLDLYGSSWERRVIPSVKWRWSTRDFKVAPIYRHYRSLKAPINQYLAIAYDEAERMKHSRTPGVTNYFPLVDRKVTRQGCLDAISAAGLPPPVKSGCFFCPFNSLDRWQWLYQTHPDLYQRARQLEENSKHFPRQRLTDQISRSRVHMPDVIPLDTLPTYFAAESEGSDSALSLPCEGHCMT